MVFGLGFRCVIEGGFFWSGVDGSVFSLFPSQLGNGSLMRERE